MKNIKKETTKFGINWGEILKPGEGEFPPKGPEKSTDYSCLLSSTMHKILQ